MKLTCELVVTEIGDGFVAIPIASTNDAFRGVVRLNETGAMIVNCLIEGKNANAITEKILSEYDDVTRETAAEAVQSVVNKLKAVGLIEE